MKSNDVILRTVILVGVAGLAFWFFTAVLRAPGVLSRVDSGVSYPQVGVRLFWEPNVVVVRVDEREERVPHGELSSSTIYQEAISRIPAGDRPAATKVRWSRVLRYWIPLIAVVWWMLFRLWQPPRPYVEGARIA